MMTVEAETVSGKMGVSGWQPRHSCDNCYDKEKQKVADTYFSKSSCVIPDKDVWSIVSINETAPICEE